MYWLDGSSKLPFVPCCSYFVSSSRALAIAGSIVLIEDQAWIVKSCVKIGDFDHWCHAASELVDLVIEFAQRDEKYLQQNGLSSHEEGLHRILELNSQFVNFVRLSTFETARIRLGAKSRTRARTCRSTPTDGQPRSVTHATPCHTLPPSLTTTTTTTSHSHNPQPTGCITPCMRVPRKEEVKEKRQRRDRKRRKREKREGEQQGKRPTPSKPTTPPPLTMGHEQDPPLPPATKATMTSSSEHAHGKTDTRRPAS